MPMKIKKISGQTALVQAGTLKRKVNLQMLPKAKAGDYVLVHAGFAIERVDPQRAKEALELFNEIC